MMHSSTEAGSMPARDGLAHDHGAQFRRGEVLERAQELAGGQADGADDDGFTSRERMSPSDRPTSRSHCAFCAVITSTPRSSMRASVARLTAGPTDARHANSTFSWQSGAGRTSCARMLGMMRCAGTIC
jgi:hypothetical protein